MDREDIYNAIYESFDEINKKVIVYDNYEKNMSKLTRRRKSIYYLEYFLPYLVASFISANILRQFDRNAFILDEVKYYENVETTLWSNGYEDTKTSTKEHFSSHFFFTTGWSIDEFGNYTRDEVHFRMDDLDNYELEEIINMSDDELEELFQVIDRKKYTRNYLTEEDKKYNEDMVVITKSERVYSDDLTRHQTIAENILDIVINLGLNILFGVAISKIVVRHRFSERMDGYFEEVKKINIDECRKLLEIRQSNLDIVSDDLELKRGSKKYGSFNFTK